MYRPPRILIFMLLMVACSSVPASIPVEDEVNIKGNYLEWTFLPNEGGVLSGMNVLGGEHNFSGKEGLLQEGFGVGSYYLPNRRLNEKLEIVEESSRPLISYGYECDGPNIKGLKILRLMEPIPSESSIRVTWTVENKGQESQWVAPWVRNEIAPLFSLRVDLPTTKGIMCPTREGYFSASRNWAAITDTEKRESVYGVFHADHVHAFALFGGQDDVLNTLHTAYVPRFLKPGDSWTTMYRLNVVKGLSKIDFACDEFALELDYANNQLAALISPVMKLGELYFDARIVAANKRVWRLPRKKFDASPERLARCTYDWTPPEPGVYEFLAQVSSEAGPLALGEDTGSPHGGIDTMFVVGEPRSYSMDSWTDAPYLLDMGPREIKKGLAIAGDVSFWFASSLEKVFKQDQAGLKNTIDPEIKMSLAKNEYESFQICIRPSREPLESVRITPSDLRDSKNGSLIPASSIEIYNVMYHHVNIPSHYEGPTGWFPDALLPHAPFAAQPGETTPVWITIHAGRDTKPGTYSGTIEISSSNGGPWEIGVNVLVHDFSLPDQPFLKTDFGFAMDVFSNSQYSRTGTQPEFGNYLDNALAHRITLRELCQMPRETADYTAALSKFKQFSEKVMSEGATTLYVPATLLEAPVQLQAANAFVHDNKLTGKAFTQLAYEPEEPAWGRVLEKMQQWKNLAPDIPVTVSTMGLKAFIPEILDIWSLHAQVLDTTQNAGILERTSTGGEVWWYVNHMPPRPYANFFLDFAAIDHRILFWQSWALGIKGMQYWCVNNWPDAGSAYEQILDITPVNGDGMLIYPGAEGPVNSIRWEVIRDGLEDYDYLALFMEYRRKLSEKGGPQPLIEKAAEVYNLGNIVPSLVSFTRDPEVLLEKRSEISKMIVEIKKAL